MLKKLFVIMLACFLIVSLVSCGEEEAGNVDYSTTIEEIIEHAKTLKKGEGNVPGKVENPGTPNFDVPSVGYDGSKVVIKFYHTMGSNLSDVLDLYIPEFNKLYPNITVEWSQIGNYDDVRNQVSTEITVGDQPNIAYCYPDHVALYNLAGAVATLDNLIDSKIPVSRADGSTEIIGLTEEQKADFIEGYYTEGQQFGDGLMYTMPFSKSTEVLYYNVDVFKKLGLSTPTHWFTEGEGDTTSMEYVCAKLKEYDPDSIPLGYDSEANWFITMCEQCGIPYTSAEKGGQFLFNNDAAKVICERLREWSAKGYVTTSLIYGTYTSGLFVAEEGTRSYMSIGSSAGATHQRPSKVDDAYPFEVGICEIPQMSSTYKRVISQGPSVCIFKKSNPQEVIASWLFVKFLTTSTEFQAEFSMASGYVPVLKSVGQNPEYAKWLNKADGGTYIAALSAKVCLEQEEAYYTSPAFNGSSTARDEVGALLYKVLSTQSSSPRVLINEAFSYAMTQCNKR